MRKQIKETYDHCKPCIENRVSRPQKSNEISQKDIFANFYQNEQIEVDFAQKGTRNFLLIVDSLMGFLQAFEVKNKSTSEAVNKVREWSALFGKPYRCKSDFGPEFSDSFDK